MLPVFPSVFPVFLFFLYCFPACAPCVPGYNVAILNVEYKPVEIVLGDMSPPHYLNSPPCAYPLFYDVQVQVKNVQNVQMKKDRL